MKSSTMLASKYAAPELPQMERKEEEKPASSPVADKPLPPSPSPIVERSAPMWSPAPESPAPTESKRMDTMAPNLPPRKKKVIASKTGKKCPILMPNHSPWGKQDGLPIPMSTSEVRARLSNFEKLGYDTRGFENWSGGERNHSFETKPQAQNRPVFPDPNEISTSLPKKLPRVKIPIKKEWDDYVNHLTEKKLAALGVGLVSDEPEEESPHQMSTQSSQQQYPGLPFSPPPPTGSAGSQRMSRSGSFFNQTASALGHRSNSSVASPMSAGFDGRRPSMHPHRNSVFGIPGMPQHPTPPGLSSFSPSLQQGGHRGGSPSLGNIFGDFRTQMSPATSGSPFGMPQNQAFPFGQSEDLIEQLQQRQRELQQQAYIEQRQNQRPQSNLAGVPEDEAEGPAPPPLPRRSTNVGQEIFVPKPQHNRNISQNLERDVMDAEEDYHLEKAIDRQLGEGGDFNTESRFDKPTSFPRVNGLDNSQLEWRQPNQPDPVLHQPQPHNRTHSIANRNRTGLTFSVPDSDPVEEDMNDGEKTNESEIDTNPSDQEPRGFGTITSGSLGESKHAASFSSASPWAQPQTQTDSNPQTAQHSAMPSYDSSKASTKLNVTAPEFKFNPTASFEPSAAFNPSAGFNAGSFNFNARPFKPGHRYKQSVAPVGGSRSPLEGFNAPFNVAAPSFQPSGLMGAPTNESAFPTGDFSFSRKAPEFTPNAPTFEPTKPAQPTISEEDQEQTSEQTSEQEAKKDDGNRIFGNLNFAEIVKPAKKSKAIPIVRPDQVEQNEERGHHREDSDGRITNDDSRQKRARHRDEDGEKPPQFVMPSHPLNDASQSQNANKPTQDPNTVGKENKSPERDVGPNPQEEVKVEAPLKAIPEPPPAPEPTKETEHIEPLGAHKKNRSSLSASAQPFEFKPKLGSFGYMAGGVMSEAEKSDDEPSTDDAPSPILNVQPLQPAIPDFVPDANTNGVNGDTDTLDLEPFNHPSFNEIDAVMKHMDQEGSDFGVERNESPWTQPMPPQAQFNPNARTQSPRRMFASAVHGDTTWNEPNDPFADDRGAAAYESPVHKLNEGDGPVSDWDDMVSSGDEEKFHERSKYFDGHVERLLEGALQSRLGPLEKSLQLVQDSLTGMASANGRSTRPGRPRSDANLDSDADDEDDETAVELSYRNRSPWRADRRMEKFKNIITEALANHQPRVPTPPAQPAHTDEMRALINEALLAYQPRMPTPPPPVGEEDIRNIVAEALASHQQPRMPTPPPHVGEENIRSIVTEALASHQPRMPLHPPPMGEQDIRSIITEVLASNQPSIPTPPPAEKEDLRSIITEVLAAQQHRQATPPSGTEDDSQDDIRANITAIKEALAGMQPPQALPPSAPEEHDQDDIRANITAIKEALAGMQPRQDAGTEPQAYEDIRGIINEALAAHQPQATPAPAVTPNDIRGMINEAFLVAQLPQMPTSPTAGQDVRSILTEVLANQQQPRAQTPPPSIAPEDIRTMITEALAAQQPQMPTLAPVAEENIREIINQALEAHQAHQAVPPASSEDQPTHSNTVPEELFTALADLKGSVAMASSSNIQLEDVKSVIETTMKEWEDRQEDRVSKEVEETASIKSQESSQKVSELEKALEEAQAKIDEEMQARREMQDREADTQRSLRLAEEELNVLRDVSRDDTQKLRSLEEESHITRMNIAVAESVAEELRKKNSDLTSETAALQATLDEYRASHSKWRSDIEHAHQEKEDLKKGINTLRLQTEEAMRVRENMRSKLSQLQEDMTNAASHVAHEKSTWHKRDEEHRKKYEVLSARIEAEARTRERLEKELDRLENQEREFMRMRVTLEQTQHHNDRLEQTVARFRQESLEHQRHADRYEREFREAREVGRAEVQRTRILMEADIEAANNQVNIVRADLEAEVARVRAELDQVKMDADHTKEKHELVLEQEADAKREALSEAAEAKREALREATEERSRVLYEQRKKYEAVLEDLRKESAREVKIANEDKERSEETLNEKLGLSASKIDHLEDKVLHLEEKLEVAKDAAQAAVQAAKSSKAPAPAPSPAMAPPSARKTGPPEKVSPQALRESIAVLQEQLQERESRIDKMQEEIAGFDTEAPNKVKERDTEIDWLRELLAVRVDDLGDLVNTLSQPAFDRDAVRDAAIRIRTNLQMEQQEKERLISGQPRAFPNLASISNFASPKAVQLAAALGNWRRGKDAAVNNLSNLNTSGLRSGSASTSRTQTPSKVNTPQGFLSGLMTPPASHLRRTPSTGMGSAGPSGSVRSLRDELDMTPRQKEKAPLPAPETPPLLRRANYDTDAEDGAFAVDRFLAEDESDADESTEERERARVFGPGLDAIQQVYSAE